MIGDSKCEIGEKNEGIAQGQMIISIEPLMY